MRRFTRLALAALAAIGASGALVAAPAASWVNFGGGIDNEDGTITYYGGNTSYAATVHGSRQTDGSVLLTDGGIEIALPSAQAQVSVMVDMSAPPESGNYDILSVVTSTYTMTARSKSRTLNLLYVTNSNGTESDRTSNGGTAAWGSAERRWVTMTHNKDANGTAVYLDDAAAALNDSDLRWSGQTVSSVKIGTANQKIYAIYLYTTRLTQADIATARAENTAALAVPLSFAFSRAGLSSAGNKMEVLQVGGGAAKASTFTATLGTTATRVTEGSEDNDTPPKDFFKSVTSDSSLLTTNGYAMVQSKFASSGSKTGEGWSIYLPFTPSVETTVTRVCPQLFAVNSEGAVQTDSKVFGYTVTLYSGSVDETTVSSATALATATGTTGSLSGTTVNTQAKDFTSALTLNADTAYTMKLAVSDRSTGGGSYSGIGGVVFSSVIGRTVSGEGTWSAGWTAGSAPADDSIVELTVSDAATLSMDAAASLSSLTVKDGSADGSASLTFSGEQSLTSAATTLNVDTDVSAITSNLGAVTLASGKTLTAQSAAAFSSITAGSGATVKYTAPSGSIAKVDNATVELAATAETSGITLPSAGGTYKVSSGTYTGMTLERTGTATTYAFTGGDMTFNGEFSFGTATATISGGTIRAPKMVTVQGGNSRPTSVTQTGGEIILSGTTDGSLTTSAVVMFGHWRYATSTYNLSGGSIKAEQGGMRFGNDSPSTLNLSGTGLLKVKGIWGNGTTDCALNLSGGTLSIGSDGFKSIGRLTVTATGGELNAFASNTIDQTIALNGSTTFSANADCEMTVQGTLSGSGALTIGTEKATGTVALGTQRPTLGGIADGAKVKLTATEAELANCVVTIPTTMTTAPAKERFTVVKPDGTTVTLTAEPTIADGTLTVTLPRTGGLITATGNWSAAGVSGERVVYVRGGESVESAITVTLDADLSGYTQIAVIGHVKFVTTATQATLPTTIALESGSVLTATASFSGNYTIPSGATVVLDGTTAISSASALTVNGALKTQGTVTLSGANAVPAGGSLSVETGTLTLTASDRSLAGTINIAAGATLVNVTGDALKYDGSPVVNVRGTLDMRSTRWTVGSGNTLNVYAGATILGVGDQHGALDFYNEATHTLNVPNEGDSSQPVTISAKLRLRQSNVILKFNIALANAKVYLTGIVRDVGKLEKAGAGSSRLILSGENKTYTGATTVSVGYLDLVGGCTLATSGVTVASGAAVTFQADDVSTETTYATPFTLTGRMDKEGAHSVILSGAITGAGAVNVKNGGLTLDASAATAEAPTAVANPITVGLDTGTAGTLTAKGFLTLSSSSNTVKATGTLTIASDTTVLTTAANAGGIKGKLAIASRATLKCGTGDAPDYNGSPSFEIGGTLELTGETRWSIPSGATFTLHSGALLKGTGPASGSNYAFDFFGGAAITADGDATIEANVGSHISDKTLTITQTAGTTTISGEVRNSLGLSVAGSGTVVYAPASSVTATSSPLSVSSGATLQLTPGSAFALNGAVSGAGKLVLGNGSAATNFTSTKTYPDASQPLTVQVKSPSTLTLNPGAGNFAFPNAVAFDVASGAELILASGMSFFGVSGEGSCSVTGDYVFGVSGTAASAGFPDAAKVLNIATLTVGTSTNTAMTLAIRPFGAIDIAPTTLKVNKNAVIAHDSNTSADADAKISLGATATVTGEGTIELPVAFTEGAVLDTVTAASLLLKGKVTGLIKVKLDTAKAVLTTSTAAELDRNTQLAFATDKTSQKFATDGYRFAETHVLSTYTFAVLPPLELPAGLPEAVTGNAAAQNAIYDAVATTKSFGTEISSVTAVKAQSTGGAAGSTEALALFENLYAVATPGAELTDETGVGTGTYEGTVTVYYDFGISQLHVKSASLVDTEEAQLYVLLCAKVATTQNTTTANYASDTIVSLYRGTEALSAVEPTDNQLRALGITPAAGEKWFAVPMSTLGSGTNAFTVKASQTTPAAN